MNRYDKIMDKDLIRRRFRKAAATYDDQAAIQRITANRLLNLLDHTVTVNAGDVLEIGCSTGLLTEQFLKRHGRHVRNLYLNDLVEDFRPIVERKIRRYATCVHFLAGDIEEINLPGSLDLILSASTLHWLADLEGLLGNLALHLNTDGLIAFSLYGPDNLREVREITGVGLRYRTVEELRELLADKFTLLAAEDRRETMWFEDPPAVLHHLRETGANALVASGWTRSRLARFTESYRYRFGDGGNIPLTYHPVYLIGRRK